MNELYLGPLLVGALVLLLGLFSTVFYAMLAVERTGREEAWTVGSRVIFASLVAHGWTATPLTRRYGVVGNSGR